MVVFFVTIVSPVCEQATTLFSASSPACLSIARPSHSFARSPRPLPPPRPSRCVQCATVRVQTVAARDAEIRRSILSSVVVVVIVVYHQTLLAQRPAPLCDATDSGVVIWVRYSESLSNSSIFRPPMLWHRRSVLISLVCMSPAALSIVAKPCKIGIIYSVCIEIE